MRFRASALLALAAPALALAHGTFEHESHETQLLKRNFFHIGSRSLKSYAGNLNSHGTNARARRHRAAVVSYHRRALAQKRSMVEVLNTSHLYGGDCIGPNARAPPSPTSTTSSRPTVIQAPTTCQAS